MGDSFTLIIMFICGVIAAVIASGKDRSKVGWFFGGFFLGLIGIIIVACLSNLKEEQQYRDHTANERRRLREQLRQERLKNEAFRQYTGARLDEHDEHLGIETRSTDQALAGAGRLLTSGQVPPPPPLPSGTATPSPHTWFYEVRGESVGPVSESELRTLLDSGTISMETLVWKESLSDWMPASRLGQLRGRQGGGNLRG